MTKKTALDLLSDDNLTPKLIYEESKLVKKSINDLIKGFNKKYEKYGIFTIPVSAKPNGEGNFTDLIVECNRIPLMFEDFT